MDKGKLNCVEYFPKVLYSSHEKIINSIYQNIENTTFSHKINGRWENQYISIQYFPQLKKLFRSTCSKGKAILEKSLMIPFHTLSVLIIPFELQGLAMHPFEESLLEADDNTFAQALGTSGLLFLVNLFFWLLWVNILLGFTNLIPMVPFDGGHMFRDMLRAILKGLKHVGRKLKFWDINPMWIEHISSKASNISSLALLGMILFILIIPYF